MKTNARPSKSTRKTAKSPTAKKKPAAKAVARGPRRATKAKRATAPKKAPARKAKSAAVAGKSSTRTVKKPAQVAKMPTAKKPARAATRSRTAARAPRSNGRVPVVREFTKREAWALFNSEARKRTGMTGKEFIEWWTRGEFEKDPDEMEGVMDVAMLLPLVEGY